MMNDSNQVLQVEINLINISKVSGGLHTERFIKAQNKYDFSELMQNLFFVVGFVYFSLAMCLLL